MPSAWLAPPAIALIGLGFYMLHNTLQTNATQMAPEARGLAVSLFAFALFTGQSVGVALAAPVMDRYGGAADLPGHRRGYSGHRLLVPPPARARSRPEFADRAAAMCPAAPVCG